MKSISKILNTIAGIFRTIVTITMAWGLVFTIFVDRNLLTAFYDLLGFDQVSPEIIKIITGIIFAFLFFINLKLTRHIFKSNKTGDYHMSNMVFAFIFGLIDLGIYFFVREVNFLYIGIFSVLLILGSIFGLIAKSKGLYPVVEIKDSEDDGENIINEERHPSDQRAQNLDQDTRPIKLEEENEDKVESKDEDQIEDETDQTYDRKDLEKSKKDQTSSKDTEKNASQAKDLKDKDKKDLKEDKEDLKKDTENKTNSQTSDIIEGNSKNITEEE